MISSQIRVDEISTDPLSRLSQVSLNLLNKDHVFDIHTHFFDIKCINKSYFILRLIKDAVGIRSIGVEEETFSNKKAYGEISRGGEEWEDELMNELNESKDRLATDENQRAIGDTLKALKFLSMKKMEQMYRYYQNFLSLAEQFNLPKENVFTTGLMMDLEIGWDTSIPKNLRTQIDELKELSINYPVLPFLACDPRRAEDRYGSDNLYALFDYAFCDAHPFFGIKIYPALGYDPFDYRLWPIYQICSDKNIPVLTHCGGEIISTDQLCFEVLKGYDTEVIKGENREEIATKMNDPERWRPVLEKFPDLKLCFGHFGGEHLWKKDWEEAQDRSAILEFMRNYPNVYADFAFNLKEKELNDELLRSLKDNPKIRAKTLFGTDYWVISMTSNLLKEQKAFLDLLRFEAPGIDLEICRENPYNYLFAKKTNNLT